MLRHKTENRSSQFLARQAAILGTLVLATASSSWGQTVRIRAGAVGAYTATDGTVWQSDQNSTGGQPLYTGYNVSGTPDPILYRYAREGYYGDFSYNIPLTNGNYQLTLKFAEIRFASARQRVFNVALNGTAVLQNFDIVAQAGPWAAIDKQFPVTISNGALQIVVHGTVNYGILNAIQVVPVSSPVTQVAPGTLTFSAVAGGANPAAQTLTVSNGGGGTLTWTGSKTQSWLTLGTTSGTAPSTVNVSASIAGLAPGTYTDTITINGGAGGTQTAGVTLNVAQPPPALGISPTSFSFTGQAGGAAPASQTLNIANTGGGTLSWNASKTQSWLSLSAGSGTGNAGVTVSVSTSGLTAGSYTDTITVSATGAASSPQQIPVSLVISAAPPQLSLSPTSLTYTATAGGTNPASQNIGISNTGGGTLTWTAAKGQTWLTLSAGSGIAPSTLTASVAISGLAAGTYTDTVTITPSTGPAQTVAISLVVSQSPPALSLSPSSLSYTATAGGSNPASQNINVSNTGGGTLTFTAAKTQTWLTLSASTGTAPSTLTASVAISGLAAGTYTDTVTITPSTGPAQTVAVSLVVSQVPPGLGLSPSSLTYAATAGGSNPASQNINVSNTGGGTLTFTAAKTQTWLTLSAGSGTAPAALGASISIAGLSAGTYTDTVTITPSTGAGQTVGVTLVVNPAAPVLSVSPGSATFTALQGGSNPASQNVSITNAGGGTLTWTASKSAAWLTLSAASGTAPSSLGLNVLTSGLAAGTYTDTVTINGPASPSTVAVTFTVTSGSVTNSAAFVKVDPTTLGSWKTVYGSQGYQLQSVTPALPAYAQVSVTGAATYTWNSSTSDQRALQAPAGTTRLAATWFQSPSFDFDINISDSQIHQVAFYSVDWDGAGRVQRVDILDSTTQAVLDTRSMSGFGNGQYAVWNLSGHVIVRFTRLAGTNAVVSGLFFDPSGQAPTGGTGAFVQLDTVTKGSWINVYGGDGFNFVGATQNSPPSYAQITPAGATAFTWSPSTTDARALQQPSGTSRVAGAWYSSTNFSLDVNMTDAGTHRVAMYALDWDSSGRSERVDVLDAVTSVVLDTQTLSNFSGGKYLVWNLQGHVIIRVTLLSGINAVASGLFFSAGPQLTPAILNVSSNAVTLTGSAYAPNSTSQAVSITNAGGGTLPWTASGTQPWLSLSATAGAAPSTLTIQASTNLLGPGTYTDTVTVSSAGVTGSPQQIAVTLTLTAPPTLGLSPLSLSYSGVAGAANPAAQTLNISNTGAGTLNWSAAKTQSWLTLSPASGAGTTPVSANVSTAGLAAGTYTDTITVTAPGAVSSPQTVAVSLVLTSPTPTISLSSSSAAFAAVAGAVNPAAQTINITNTGGGTLNWNASNNLSWLTLSASSGTAPSALGLNVSIAGLSAGTYTDTVTISAPGAGNSPRTIAVTLTVSASAGTAVSFVKIDTTTQGSWKNVYGAEGYNLIGIPPSVPSYAQLAVNGPFIFTWTANTSDVRALQIPNSSSRVEAAWYGSGTFSYDLNLTDGLTHQISLYAADYDNSGRAERIDLIDTATGAVLDTRTLTGFSGGQTVVWNITGQVRILVTQLLGPNAVVSGLFFDAAGASPVGSTLFERMDTTTLGNWQNGYGGDGYSFVGATPSLPSYAQVSVSPEAAAFVWAGATNDGRALQIPNSTNRAAGAWYQASSFTFDVNLTDSNTHRVAVYALDYDGGGRTERVDIIDAQTGVTLDSRTVGPFNSGRYLVWNLAGHVLIKVTRLAGTNAVMSGIFFGRSPLVTTPATLSVSANTLTLAGVAGGANPSPQGISIINNGIGSLAWTANANQPWLTLSGSGTAPSTLSIGASLAGLSPGTYTGTVGIGAAGALGSPQAVTVTLNVRAQPAILSLSQTGLTFATATAGTNPPSQSVFITNAGSSTLPWTATATQSWVTLSATSGTAPSSLSIGVSTAGLAAGIYTDTVVISSADAAGSPAGITVTLVVGSSSGQHYVSTQGSPNGDGSINNPWDLQTALYHPASVQPGDTIWIRGGVYGNGAGIFYSRLLGSPILPIVVKQFPGERAQINGWLQIGCCDQNPQPTMGGYVTFWGLEFASTITDRTGFPSGQSVILDAIDTWAPGTKLINNVVHDSRVGISMWKEAVGSEAYGNVIYFNGFQASDRGHGHGFYVQNNNGTMRIADNVMFDQFNNGMQFYGSSAAFVKNLLVEGNISFNNGAISTGGSMGDNAIFVNTNGVSGVQLLNNYFYFTPSLGLGYVEMGWPGPNQDIVVQGNYFVGGFQAVSFQQWDKINFQNNTVYTNKYAIGFVNSGTPTGYTWDYNHYYGDGLFSYNGISTFLAGWQGWTNYDTHSTSASVPSGVWTFVRPNQYEPGRANIAVYNWDQSPSVTVPVSNVLTVGARYQVRDAQNFFGPPIASGTYTGTPITIPMAGLTIAVPSGTVPTVPTHTAPQFGAFVLTTLQ